MTVDRLDPMVAAADEPYDARGKSMAEIEGDITRTRAELGAVIDALERRFAPRQLLERGVDMLKDQMSAARIGETLRGHPVPLALIGAGVGWLLMTSAAGDKPAEYVRRLGDRLTGAARSVTDGARGLAGGAADEELYPAGEELAGYAYARTKPRIAAAAAAAADTADRAMSRARAGLQRTADDYPLALGVLGLLAGAALALMLPRLGVAERWRGLGPGRPRGPETGPTPGYENEATRRLFRVAGLDHSSARPWAEQPLSGAGPGAGPQEGDGMMDILTKTAGAALLLALAVAPRAGAQDVLSAPDAVRACLCRNQSAAALAASLNSERQTYTDKKNALDTLDQQASAAKQRLNLDNLADREALGRLLSARDAAQENFASHGDAAIQRGRAAL